ncbi:MAG: NUDIX domain-containing protein [Actinomycetales bacterium]|nr:NUDIX domain-containing protein [Actinomycetales bacterium]
MPTARPPRSRRRRLPRVEETSAGGFVIDRTASGPRAALIARHDSRGRLVWSLPKGHIEAGESPEQAAVREIHEETGIHGRIVESLGTIDFWFMAEDRRVHKTVHHYVLRALDRELSDEDVEVVEVAWVPLDEVASRLRYPDERSLVDRVREIVDRPESSFGPA